MSLDLVLQQALNGISFGALLFILAAGLSLIFGMMDVVNLAHGAFYMLGAYIALKIVDSTGQFWPAIVVAPVALALLGLAIEPTLLRRLRGRHLDQVLLTIGVSLVIADLIGLFWGRDIRSLPFPPGLDGSVVIAGNVYPVYRLFVIVFAVVLAGLLAYLHEHTEVGALIVVVVGGLGTLTGAAAGAGLVGPADTFGKMVFQDFALALIFAIMALILLARPTGLFGRIRIAR